MAEAYEKQLEELLAVNFIREADFIEYLKKLADLSKFVNKLNDFQTYAPVVKKWIAEFETIFSAHKFTEKQNLLWLQYMSGFCGSVTKIYLDLLQGFHQFEPRYSQDFYLHWKAIISRLSGVSRAKSFAENIDRFIIVIDHLRIAEHRCEQLSILALLKLYIERVPIEVLAGLKKNDNKPIIDRLIEWMKNPRVLKQHSFLHHLNALGHCIESLKPKKIIFKKLNINHDSSEYEMWLDFNKKDKSIVFLSISLIDTSDQTLGIAAHIKLRENRYDDHMLEINGIWSVMSNNQENTEVKGTVKVFLSDDVETLITRAVKNTFRFVSHGTNESSQELLTDMTEITEVTHSRNPEIDDCNIESSPSKRSRGEDHSSSISSHSSPLALYGRYINNSSLPIFDRLKNFNLSLPLPTVKGNMSNSVRDERPSKLNSTYTAKPVNPIALMQSENDRIDNDVMSMDIVEPQNEHKEPLIHIERGETFTIIGSEMSDISYGEDDFVLYDNSGDDADVEFDMCNEENDKGHTDFSRKKIRIIDDIVIVPKRSQTERAESVPDIIDYLPTKANMRFLHCSQVNQRLSENRKVAFNVFSQPTTSIERFYIEDPANRRLDVEENYRSNWSVSSPPEMMEIIDETNRSDSDTGERFPIPLVQNLSEIKIRSKDHTLNTSRINSQQVRSQSQYELFVPIASSTQQVQDKNALPNPVENSTGASCSQRIPQRTFEVATQTDQDTSKSRKISQNRSEIIPQAIRTSQSLHTKSSSQKKNETEDELVVPPATSVSQDTSKSRKMSQNGSKIIPQAIRTSQSSHTKSSSQKKIETEDEVVVPPATSVSQDTLKSRKMSQNGSEIIPQAIRTSQSSHTKSSSQKKIETEDELVVPPATSVSQETSKFRKISQNRSEIIPEAIRSSQSLHTKSSSQKKIETGGEVVVPPAILVSQDTSKSRKMSQNGSEIIPQAIRTGQSSHTKSSSQEKIETGGEVVDTSVSQDTSKSRKISQNRSETIPQSIRTAHSSQAKTSSQKKVETGNEAASQGTSKSGKKSQIQKEILSQAIQAAKRSQDNSYFRKENESVVPPTTTDDLIAGDHFAECFIPPVIEIETADDLDTSQVVAAKTKIGKSQVSKTQVSNEATQQTSKSGTRYSSLNRPKAANQRPSNSMLGSTGSKSFDVTSSSKTQVPSEATPVRYSSLKRPKTVTQRPSNAMLGSTGSKSFDVTGSSKAQVPIEATSVRYSSLKRPKTVAQRPSNSMLGSTGVPSEKSFDATSPSNQTAAANVTGNNSTEHSSDGIQCVDGMVYDSKGCVFANDEDLQRAAAFYIANDGLAYLKTRSFKFFTASKREKIERELRAIYTMMNHKEEISHPQDEETSHHEGETTRPYVQSMPADPYEIPSSEAKVQRTTEWKSKSKVRSSKEVTVTISSQQTVQDSKKVTFTRRVSKLIYVVDDETSSCSTNQEAPKQFFKLPKNFKKPQSAAKPSGTKETVTKKLPVYASDEMKVKNRNPQNVMSSTEDESRSPAKIPNRKIPIHAAENGRRNNVTSAKNFRSSLMSSDGEAYDSMDIPADDQSVNMNQKHGNEFQCQSGGNEGEICNIPACNENMNDLAVSLREMMQQPVDTNPQRRHILKNFFDSLHSNQMQQNGMVTDYAQGAQEKFEEFVSAIESICEQFKSI